MKLTNFSKHIVGIQTWLDQLDRTTMEAKQKKRLSLIEMSKEFAADIKGDSEDEMKERQGEWDTIRNNGKYFDDFPVIKTGATKHTKAQIKWLTHNKLVLGQAITELVETNPVIVDALRLILRPSTKKGGYWTLESVPAKLAEAVEKEQKRAIKEKRDNVPEMLLEGAFHSPSPPPIPKPSEEKAKEAEKKSD